MTATRAVPAPSVYRSGYCTSGFHFRCRGIYGGTTCTCRCHQLAEVEPAAVVQPPPTDRLELAAAALAVDHQPLPPAARTALAVLLRSEAAHAAHVGDLYPADRAPLLALADLINGATTL